MLADDDAVRALYGGADGIAAGLRPGTVAIDMSTVLPATIAAVGAASGRRGAGVLDAPVSGSVSTALAGELTIMVGGEAADLERARPALERLAKRIFHLGPLGTGAAMKLAVNTVVYGLNGAVSEALVLAERSGIARATAYDVLAASAVGAPFVHTSGRRSSTRTRPRSRSRWPLPRRTCTSSPNRPRPGHPDAPGRSNLACPGRGAVGGGRQRSLRGRGSPA